MLRQRRRRPFATPLLAAIFALLSTRSALADSDADQCVAASEKGQQLKNAGKLGAARDQLAICSRAECPKLVLTDCTKWMGEVLSALPSVVPAAKDEQGRDVVEATLSVDGTVVTRAFDGKPITVDPGVHIMRFERAGAAPREERVVIKSGEQNRIISVTLAVAPVAPPHAAPVEQSHSDFPVLPVILGAAGVVLGGVAVYLDVKATSDAHELRKTCAPRCGQSDVDDLHTRYLIAGVGAGLGVVALAAAGFLYLRRNRSDSPAVGLSFTPVADGYIAQGRISF